MFGFYWGAVSIALPLFIRVGLPERLIKLGVRVPPRYPKDIFFLFCVIVSLFVFGMKGHNKKYLSFTTLFLIVLGFINQDNYGSIATYFQFTMMSAGLILLNQLVSNASLNDITQIKKSFAISCIIQSVLIVVSYFGADLYKSVLEIFFHIKSIKMHRSVGFDYNSIGLGSLGNRNVSGAFVASTIPFLFSGKFKLFLPLCLSALFITSSSMPLVSVLCGGMLLVYLRAPRKVFPFFLAVPALFYYLAFHTEYFNPGARIALWKMVIDHTTWRNVIFGSGLGYVFDNYKLFSWKWYKFYQLHNEYLELFVAYGLAGCAVIGGFFYNYRNKFINGDKQLLACAAIVMANAFGFFNFHISSTALIGIIAIGCLIRGVKCHEAGIIKL